MHIVLTKAFLQQALYEMGANGAIRLNTTINEASIQSNPYSTSCEKINDYSVLSTTDSKDKKIIIYLSK